MGIYGMLRRLAAVMGGGTTNYYAMWNSETSLGDGYIFYDTISGYDYALNPFYFAINVRIGGSLYVNDIYNLSAATKLVIRNLGAEDIILGLSDNAGVRKINVWDSDNAVVASIDSDGNFFGVQFQALTPASNNFKVKLGDAAGARKFSILDSANVEVASIDSDGLLTWTDIPDDSVKIEHLDAIDAPADEEVFAYDSATGRGEWVAGGGFPSLSQYVRVFDDFFSALTGDGMIGQQPWGAYNYGTGSAVSLVITDAAHPGVCQMATGTTATGYAGIILGGEVAMVFGGGEQLEFNFYIAALADVGNDYECRMGFLDKVAADPAEGAYFEYDRDTSANWLICASDNSVRTQTASATAVTTGWHRFKIVVNSDATSIEYFIDDASLGTVTTNIPKTAARCFGIGFSNIKEAGTTTRLFYTDYIDFVRTLSTPR